VFLPLSQLQHLYRIDYLKENNGIESNKEEEIDGLDIHEHGANVYNS
jgi:ammonia channel protein AmtB